MSSGMEGDLLRREQEFHKINSELEERTSRILQEINDAKSKTGLNNDVLHQRNITTINHTKSFSLKKDVVLSSNLASKDERETCVQTKRDVLEDPLAFRSNGLGYEATNRLLRAKLTILTKEVDTLRQDYKIKSEECRKTTSELNRSEEECARLESLLSAARDSTANLQNKLEASSLSLTRSQNENVSLSKELASLKKDLKQQRQQSSAIELRLNRAVEDADKFRNTARQTQLQNKEDRENQRKNLEQLQSKIKSLERQRTELSSVCTKQLHLIDNLRRQKAHMDAARFEHVTETEFDNVLDWCLRNKAV